MKRHDQFINNHHKAKNEIEKRFDPRILALTRLLARMCAQKSYTKAMRKQAKLESQKEV